MVRERRAIVKTLFETSFCSAKVRFIRINFCTDNTLVYISSLQYPSPDRCLPTDNVVYFCSCKEVFFFIIFFSYFLAVTFYDAKQVFCATATFDVSVENSPENSPEFKNHFQNVISHIYC